MPHPHSLFLLADHHHHHHDGTIEDEHGDVALKEIATRGLVVQSSTTEGGSGEQISFALEEFGAAAWAGTSETFAWPLHLRLSGIGEPPELPPPRSPIAVA